MWLWNWFWNQPCQNWHCRTSRKFHILDLPCTWLSCQPSPTKCTTLIPPNKFPITFLEFVDSVLITLKFVSKSISCHLIAKMWRVTLQLMKTLKLTPTTMKKKKYFSWIFFCCFCQTCALFCYFYAISIISTCKQLATTNLIINSVVCWDLCWDQQIDCKTNLFLQFNETKSIE